MKISLEYYPESAFTDVQCKMILSSVFFSHFVVDLNRHKNDVGHTSSHMNWLKML